MDASTIEPLPDKVIDALLVQAMRIKGKPKDVIRMFVRLIELEIELRGQQPETTTPPKGR